MVKYIIDMRSVSVFRVDGLAWKAVTDASGGAGNERETGRRLDGSNAFVAIEWGFALSPRNP